MIHQPPLASSGGADSWWLLAAAIWEGASAQLPTRVVQQLRDSAVGWEWKCQVFRNAFRFGLSRRLRVGPRVGNAQALGQIVAVAHPKLFLASIVPEAQLVLPFHFSNVSTNSSWLPISLWQSAPRLMKFPPSFHKSSKESSSSSPSHVSSERKSWPHHIKQRDRCSNFRGGSRVGTAWKVTLA